MSISTLQEKFFNKGCGTALIVIAAVAMGVSMFTRGSAGSSRGERDGERRTEAAVAIVGGVPVLGEAIQTTASEQTAQAMQRQALETHASVADLPPPDAGIKALALANATQTTLQQAALTALIARSPVTEAEVTEMMNGQIAAQKADYIKQGKLKAGATDADLEKAMKDELKGRTLAQIRQENVKFLVGAFKDPKTASAAAGKFGAPILAQRFGAEAVGSDQALRDSYKSYVVRSIVLNANSGAKESPEARAQKALADLKAGKSFQDEMDAVSNAPAPPGKKARDVTVTIPASALSSRPELASLVGKAPNTITPVVDVPGGKAIYQLVSVKDELPKDFDANKAKYRAEKVRAAGGPELDKRVKAMLAGDAVKWNSPGYQALAAVADASGIAGMLDPNVVNKAFALGQTAVKSDNPNERHLGTEALLALTDPKSSPGATTTERTANRLVALEAAQANGLADGGLMLELAGVYGDSKNGAKATDALIAASKANFDYGTQGQRVFGDIAAKALDLQKKGVLTAAQLQSVQAQQAAWTAAQAENAKTAAQAKTNSTQQQLSNEAEIARQKAEAAQSVPAPGAPPAQTAPSGAGDATKKANDAEIARQKGEAGTKPPSSRGKAPAAPPKGGSLLPPGVGH